MKVFSLLLVAVLVTAWAAPAGRAGPLLDGAAESLADDPVYVHPEAEPGLSATEAERLRDDIAAAGGGPVYIAVLPEEARAEAGGDSTEALRLLADELRRDGTYAVVVGGQFRAGSNRLERGRAAELATEAFDEHANEGLAATLAAFVALVGEEAQGGGEDGGDGFSPGFLVVLGLLAVPVVFVLLRRRRKQAEGFADVREAAEEELVALADDVRELEDAVAGKPAAAADYERALEHYERASRAFDRARKTEDFEEVTAAVEEGRFAMAEAKARLERRPLPERRPPCFFDPRHGPSTQEVEWAPPGGAPRRVPACEADALRVERGEEPSSREVPVRGERVPYWAAPGYYQPWAGGFFGGGLLPGFLVGSMLGDFGPSVEGNGGGEGDGDFGDFGDFGGGGGADFGGGGDF